MKYGLDEKPGLLPFFLYGLQWWVVSLPSVVIMGVVVAKLHYSDVSLQTFAMQKLFGVMGIATVIQVLWGHRLPLVAGPASALLVGIVAAAASGVNAIYTAALTCGALLSIASFCGLMSRLRFFFTPRIVAVILVLIAFTLAPTILRLILAEPRHAALHLCFAGVMVFTLILCNTWLPGIWKSLTVIIGLAGGSLTYFAFSGFPQVPQLLPVSGGFPLFITSLDFHAGTILSFVFCFLALAINELGSIETVGHLLRADGMPGRIDRGVGLQGLSNMAAGGLGIIGPVDFSLSAGMIAATGCASRYTLVPAGIAMLACGFFPRFVLLLTCVPSVVMGALMLYLMASQLSSGLTMLVLDQGITDFNTGMTVGLPLMLGLLVSFTPATAFAGTPELLRPIIANGFVVGTIAVIVLEHVIFRTRKQ